MTPSKKHRKILSGCLIISLSFHALGLVFLQHSSLWFSSPSKTQESCEWLSLVDKQERDQILKSTFELSDGDAQEGSYSYRPNREISKGVPMHAPIQMPEPEYLPFFENLFSFSADQELLTSSIFPTFSISSEPLNLLDYLPKELIVPAPSKSHSHKWLPLPNQLSLKIAPQIPKLEEQTPPSPIDYSKPVDPLPLSETKQAGKAPSMIPLPHLPKLPTLAELETSSYSDAFDADLVFLPKEDGSGYLFALTLIPQPDLELPRIRQNYFFLLDRSNSIQQGRLTATKAAIHKALEDLYPEDTFNIIAFDSKVDKMSPVSLPCVGKSFAIAESFLETVQLGSFFSSSDLYKPLLGIVPSQVQNDELYTAILLTDGETLGKKTTQKALLKDWTQYNRGKVALYAIGLNGDPQIPSLDIATAFNKGKVCNAPTNRGLKRKLLKLLKMIQNPICKNLSCQAISRSPHAKIQLFPNSAQIPHLYLDQPYVILGETNSLDDFILFVQGHLKNRWLNIKKTISFVNAKKGNKSLRQEWALQRAYSLYEQYISDENPKHLTEAQALLEPFDHQVAFR